MRRGRSRIPIAPRRWPRILLLVVAVFSAAFGMLIYGPGPAARSGAFTLVTLPGGSGVAGIAEALSRAGVVRSNDLFIAWAEASGAARELKAGQYRFDSFASLAAVVGEIRAGKVVRYWVTIPEGLSSVQVVAVLSEAPELTGDVAPAAEGSLLPSTYQVAAGESRSHLVRRMQKARNDVLGALWPGRAAGLPYRSPEQAVILASIVEKETAMPEERPRIAAVFLNRLAKGMRLGSDPTVVYGLTGGIPLGHGLRVSELARQTPFNTYAISGLPPTPIANPGRASLIAALHPAQTEDLYFVADGSGGHAFAAKLAEHQRNVTRWRAIESARQIPTAGTGGR